MAEEPVTAAEARAIAKEAYVYGFPIVDIYRILYAYFVSRGSPEFKAPWNQLVNAPRVYTPEDKAIQTPNSDTPYSFAPNRWCSPSRRSTRNGTSASS
jgi:hypothetical protein